jgi:serine/threonine-protein kinase
MDSGFDIWLQLGLPAAIVAAGVVALLARRRMSKRNVRNRDDAQAADAERLMALAFQGQGKLDAAWQKFQALPASATLLDDLLALAGAFEKASKPKKAIEVLRVVQERHPGYRDVDARMAQARNRAVLARAAEAKPEAPPARPRFGAFEVERELGRGELGVVYLGRDPVIGREVAIRTLPLEQEFAGAEAAEAKSRLFAEVRAAGGLSHPNIVTIYDAGEAQGACYIAMELLAGGSLAAHLAPDSLLPAAQVAEIVARAAEALGHAHREGVVHYDVRPGNIMVQAETGLVKVTDFGIARLTAAAKSRAARSASAYQAPEQRADGLVDGRADLYALGVTLCQLLTSRLPAEVADFEAEVPAGLGAVVARAVAANPNDRFQTGDEFSAALRAAVQAGADQPAALDIQL